MLCIPANDSTNIFFTDYTVTLLLPLMLFGAMRYGYQLTSLVWSASVITLLINYDGFVQWDNLAHSLALIMSMMVMFTLTIILMAAVNTRQRRLYIKTQRASMIDPVIQLPNLRCLHHDLKQHERSVVCFLRIANLDTLCRTYGMQLRLEYKQRLASMMKKVMANNEGVYQLPSYDLVLRLNNKSAAETLKRLNDAMKAFRLLWNGLPLRLHYGIGYCTVRQPLEHIYTIIGELSSMAERSLITGNAESTHLNAQTLQEGIHSKVAMLHHIQNGLDKDRFMLMAQPIEGFRGDRYYEVLLRLQDEHGNIIMPNDFFPVVQEFGLNYDVDLWVLNNTLAFINENRERLPAVCFAINLTPSTLARPTLVQDIARILAQYQVEPYQIILEITESNITQTKELTSKTLSQLRQMGCRIAIDDFGTGFASYDRLKHIEADILKIDGSFVRQLMDSPIDQQIVSAMCQIARLKKLLVVAEYVEDEAQKFQLKALGVDYIQGYLLGKPQPLSSL
jgi:EAL domain-containing protein (putative c-di-GMP-specific phosphodiesterase class I)/GGDEF domain-containing protein